MAAATLPLSRSMRMPLSSRQDTNESFRVTDDWGPSSIPPTTQANVPWDDQVVPALRKKLEAESKDLTKRISRIEGSDSGWSRSRGPDDRPDPRISAHARDVQDRRMSREVVKHHRESSIDQFHNRFATVRAPSRQTSQDIAASSFPFGQTDSQDSSVERGSLLSNDATARTKEKARQIAARQKGNQQMQLSRDSMVSSIDMHGSSARPGNESSIDTIAEGDAVTGDAGQSSQSFRARRLRTQSNPTRPSLDVIDPNYASTSRQSQNQSSQDPSQRSQPAANTKMANGHQRSSSLSRRKAAAAAARDPALLDEFGPLGATPSPTSKLLQAHQSLDPSSPSVGSFPSTRSRNIQPDAFRSLSRPDQARSLRETSAPPAFGGDGDTSRNEFGGFPGSKSVNSWEDQIIPTVARKLQQEQFLQAGKEGRLSRYEGLIDTWDKNGLPLSRSDVMAMQRAKKQQEEQQQQQQSMAEVAEEQQLTPGPAPVLQQRRSNLSPTVTGFGERSRSRASSRRSQRSARSYQQQQYHQQQQHSSQLGGLSNEAGSVPMQTFERQEAAHSTAQQQTAAPVTASVTQRQTTGTSRQHATDKVEKSGCCCIIM